MAERFEKTYISINEFVSSWEKEIYELNNLDYFTFILINYLGYQIEHDFFNNKDNTLYLKIDPEEIATLVFNIGDSFESFLEHNCFGDCSLSCPTKLEEKVSPSETDLGPTHLNIIQIMNGTDLSKKQFLLTDILNYVVLDTLFDFYNYEIGLDLDDADVGLMQFADYITVILEKFIEAQGQTLLTNPQELATDLFESIISESDYDWDDNPPAAYEDNEEKEEWKYGNLSVTSVVQDYLQQNPKIEPVSKRLLEYFLSYAQDYTGIVQIDDFETEDLEEFFLFWLIREISLEHEISIDHIKRTFEKFFIWLELSRNVEIKDLFDSFISKNHSALGKALKGMHSYFEDNSLIGGILEANVSEDKIINGFFLVKKVTNNGFLKLRDIHFQQTYINVRINLPEPALLNDTILDASIKFTAYGWRIVNLEYIFPATAKPFLH